MKRTILVLLMVASAAALFANGNAERPGAADLTGPDTLRSRAAFDEDFTPPTDAVFTDVELTGTVEIVDGRAILTADGMTYLLAVPRIAWYEDEIEDGAVITVNGSLVEGVDHDQVDFEGDGYIAVDTVEINGEVLALGAPGGYGAYGTMRGTYADGDVPYGGRFSSDDWAGRGGMYDEDWTGRGPMMDDDDFGNRPMVRGRRI